MESLSSTNSSWQSFWLLMQLPTHSTTVIPRDLKWCTLSPFYSITAYSNSITMASGNVTDLVERLFDWQIRGVNVNMRMAGIAVVTEQSKNIELLTISDNCSTRIILVYPTGAPQEKKIQLFFEHSSGNIYILSVNKSKGDITVRWLCRQQPLIKSWNADCVIEGSKLAHDFTCLF